MKVLNAEFVTSAAAGAGRDGIPRDRVPQIAFAGRSNVGKSSLLNALCRRSIARTSAAPGKTRLANVYRVTADGGPGGPGRWSVYFVDLPGYGYARGGANAASELARVAEGYFAGARDSGPGTRDAGFGIRPRTPGAFRHEPQAPGPESRHVLLLVDARHPGLESDVQAHAWLREAAAVPHVVANKVDKLARADRTRNLKALEEIFGTAALPVSATGGEGLDELWTLIAKLVRNK